MRFKKTHTRNGVRHERGDPYSGPVNSGRFLYQRGVLEPDGGPDDDAITRNAGPRARQQWGFEDTNPPPEARPEHAPSLDEIELTPRKDKEQSWQPVPT
jgi:hypothetical protein